MTVELTDQETTFLLSLVRQLSVNPASPDAAGLVATVQAIVQKLTAKGESQ